MTMAFGPIPSLVRITLADPAEGVRRLQAMDLPVQVRGLAFAFVAIVTILPTEMLLLAVPEGDLTPLELAMRRPVAAALAQAVTMLLVAGAITVVGRWFGGRARFADAVVAVAWVQFILFLFQIAQFALLAVFPPIGVLFSLVSVGVLFWLMVGVTAALNGFSNRLLVLLAVVATGLVIAFCLGAVAAALGIVPGIAANV
jgi:hypothetical protein